MPQMHDRGAPGGPQPRPADVRDRRPPDRGGPGPMPGPGLAMPPGMPGPPGPPGRIRGGPRDAARNLRKIAPLLWSLARPRLGYFLVALVLIMSGRATALVAPLSTRYLVDEVIGHRNVSLLLPLVSLIVAAAVAQGLLMLLAMRVMFE